jgi:ribose 5-phosphate isomerase B
MTKIAIASDHAGFKLKSQCIELLTALSYKVLDLGAYSGENSVDYPDYAKLVCEELVEENSNVGILICGSGIGMSIAANRVSNIRAALCLNVDMAFTSRAHNNANVLVMGSRITSYDQAKEIIMKFLNTSFEGGRHLNRIQKIS